MPMQLPQIGPQAVKGIELNPYAAEIARVVMWIGEIQWMLNNGFAYHREPILRLLEASRATRCATRLERSRASGRSQLAERHLHRRQPPFIGGKLMRSYLGDAYVDQLFRGFDGRVPREADFVTYWHEKARAMLEAGRVERVGLLAHQGIRGGANRRVLERIKETGEISPLGRMSRGFWMAQPSPSHSSPTTTAPTRTDSSTASRSSRSMPISLPAST